MSESLLGKPGFSSNKLEANYHVLSAAVCTGWFNGQAHKSAATTVWLTSNHQLEGTIGRVADTAHTGSFTTRRSYLNHLWIHIMLSTPMIYKLCRFISRSNVENLKPTPRVTLRLGGYNDMIQQMLPVFANLRTLGRWREGQPGPGGYYYIDESLKAIRKFLV